RLREADQCEIVDAWAEDPLEEGEPVLRRREEVIVEEGEGDLVARRPDDRVDALNAAVLEPDAVSLELRDVGLRDRIARPEPEQQLAGHGGMSLEELVVGGGEAEVLHAARGEVGEGLREEPLEAERDARIDLDDRVERAAEEVLRNHPGAAARRDEDL